MTRLLLLTAVFLIFSSSSEKTWEKTNNGVEINLKGEAGRTARLGIKTCIYNCLKQQKSGPFDIKNQG